MIETGAIDCHAHLVPPSWFNPASPRNIFDIPRLLEEQYQAGVAMTVFGNNWIRTPEGKSPLHIIMEFNEFAAETTTQYPGRLLGLASSIPFGDDEVLKETERAIRQYGLKGIMITSSVDGEYLDSPRAESFFQLVSKLGVPLFVHPPKETIGAEKMERWRLFEMVGRPFDTTLSLTRFIYNGGLEKFPDLRIVAAHLGGALPGLFGRLDTGYILKEDSSFGPWEPDVLSHPPSWSIRKLYVDTVSYWPPAIKCAIDTFGIDKVVFGSDSPPVPISLRKAIEVVEALEIPPEDKDKILRGNAQDLLGLVFDKGR